MCLLGIISSNIEFKKEVEKLWKESPFYPHLRMEFKDDELVASSIIRKEKEGKWYSVLLVKRMVYRNSVNDSEILLAQFIAEAYNIILFYKINAVYDRICPIQISEEERLIYPKP